MESKYTELALYGSKNECARIDYVYFSISEVCDGTVSLIKTIKITIVKISTKKLLKTTKKISLTSFLAIKNHKMA